MKGKSKKSDEKLEGKIGPVMCVHMDANAALSQLSYEPILTDIIDFADWDDS